MKVTEGEKRLLESVQGVDKIRGCNQQTENESETIKRKSCTFSFLF